MHGWSCSTCRGRPGTRTETRTCNTMSFLQETLRYNTNIYLTFDPFLLHDLQPYHSLTLGPDMEFLEVLTEGLERVLLVRGGGGEVITIYS
ncbi:hypothetical protein F7725_004791 [Dissostichus mawsoni]|uniref:Uncharacterized protein n=1 Tax=Dissostichus mawsoni TaxID=36200 RepID=A0A7J5XL74_DISMA|nr:hypothetical protein F7725_004791 [Dissostichus mawsoni]